MIMVIQFDASFLKKSPEFFSKNGMSCVSIISNPNADENFYVDYFFDGDEQCLGL